MAFTIKGQPVPPYTQSLLQKLTGTDSGDINLKTAKEFLNRVEDRVLNRADLEKINAGRSSESKLTEAEFSHLGKTFVDQFGTGLSEMPGMSYELLSGEPAAKPASVSTFNAASLSKGPAFRNPIAQRPPSDEPHFRQLSAQQVGQAFSPPERLQLNANDIAVTEKEYRSFSSLFEYDPDKGQVQHLDTRDFGARTNIGVRTVLSGESAKSVASLHTRLSTLKSERNQLLSQDPIGLSELNTLISSHESFLNDVDKTQIVGKLPRGADSVQRRFQLDASWGLAMLYAQKMGMSSGAQRTEAETKCKTVMARLGNEESGSYISDNVAAARGVFGDKLQLYSWADKDYRPPEHEQDRFNATVKEWNLRAHPKALKSNP